MAKKTLSKLILKKKNMTEKENENENQLLKELKAVNKGMKKKCEELQKEKKQTHRN